MKILTQNLVGSNPTLIKQLFFVSLFYLSLLPNALLSWVYRPSTQAHLALRLSTPAEKANASPLDCFIYPFIKYFFSKFGCSIVKFDL